MTPEQLEGIEAREKSASDHIADLCNARKIWTMRIPADPERDSDLILSRSLSDVPALVAEVRRLRAAIDSIYKMHESGPQNCKGCGYAAPCGTRRSLDAVLDRKEQAA